MTNEVTVSPQQIGTLSTSLWMLPQFVRPSCVPLLNETPKYSSTWDSNLSFRWSRHSTFSSWDPWSQIWFASHSVANYCSANSRSPPDDTNTTTNHIIRKKHHKRLNPEATKVETLHPLAKPRYSAEMWQPWQSSKAICQCADVYHLSW